uniref:TonB-dependent receptor n=1 Tax=Haliea sp. ETY-M TaxID=1055105 RepID=A0A455R077_9GAMM|nr:TonB-dependent receptor [Haliea sp. ETY-M]
MKIPGGIGLVEAHEFLDNFTQSIGDALIFTPGVFADTSAQRENRISIRGSGLNATFERRGITVLRDGVPISRASGITEFQEIDPLSIDYIEVYKGANGLRYGAASLGGAINIVTPTGSTRPPGTTVRIEGGSFDTTRGSVSSSGRNGATDYAFAVTKLDSDGFREHAEVDSLYGFGNVGIQLTDRVATRFYLTALRDDFELAGALSLQDALTRPERSPSENTEHDMDRNLDVWRVSNRTVFNFDNFSLKAAAWVARRDLDHAITQFVGVIDQSEDEYGLSLELSGLGQIAGRELEWVLGGSYASSENEAKVFAYQSFVSAQRGALSSEDRQDASNTIAYGQLDIALSPALNLIVGLQYVDSQRDNRNVFNARGEDDSGSLQFDSINGRLGLLHSPADSFQLFANASQGYEPPGIADLTAGGADPFTALDAQESFTLEVGSRGVWGIAAWDLALYRSEVDNEFIDVANPASPFAPPVTENALGDTVHQGVELGVDLRPESFGRNDELALLWRNTLTYNDFNFDGDPIYGDNALAGVPELVYVSELRLDYLERWYVGVNLRRITNGAYADFANSLRPPGYHLIGATWGYQVTPKLMLFGSAENLADEAFVANVSTVAGPSLPSAQIFTPGEGRAVYVGISLDL